jgi:hypothetical protein
MIGISVQALTPKEKDCLKRALEKLEKALPQVQSMTQCELEQAMLNLDIIIEATTNDPIEFDFNHLVQVLSQYAAVFQFGNIVPDNPNPSILNVFVMSLIDNGPACSLTETLCGLSA